MASEHLTQALQSISKWLELSHLTLNVKKTVSMCFSIRNRPARDVFKVWIKNELTEAVNEVKYLGILTEVFPGFGLQKYMIPTAHSILISTDFGNELRVNQHVY